MEKELFALLKGSDNVANVSLGLSSCKAIQSEIRLMRDILDSLERDYCVIEEGVANKVNAQFRAELGMLLLSVDGVVFSENGCSLKSNIEGVETLQLKYDTNTIVVTISKPSGRLIVDEIRCQGTLWTVEFRLSKGYQYELNY